MKISIIVLLAASATAQYGYPPLDQEIYAVENIQPFASKLL